MLKKSLIFTLTTIILSLCCTISFAAEEGNKINLGNERYVFKPVSIVKGKYDEEASVFETEYGELCAPIDGDSQFEDSYFGWHITLDDLKLTYKDQGLSEEEMLTQYFDECVMYFCLHFLQS